MCQAIAGAHYWQSVVNQLHLPIINLGWNIQFMQIVSEALFQRIKEQALFYTSTHNRIAYVTQSELILREITLQARSESIKIKGKQVIALSLQNANFIVILFASGSLQVRKVDSLKQVLLHTSLALHKDTNIKMRVSSESIYVLNRHYIDVVGLSKQKTFRKIYLQNKKQQPQDIVISTIFEEEIIILQFKESIAITTEGKAIAQAPFTNINTFKVLKDPLFIGQSKEFLLVVESKRYLKIFDIFDLQQILQMQLFFEENQQLQLKVDPLSQFVMLKIFQTNGVTKRNSLLKINTDFYRGEATEPFFLFDIQIGLKHDFILFPSHNELIKGAKFHSVDMCFFTKKEIRIASLVIDVNHRTKLNNVKCVSTNWKSESGWKDFFFNVKTDELQKQQKKFDQIQFHQESQEEHWEKFISKFYQQNMQKFKCQNFYKINQAAQPKKYLQYSTRYNKDLIENEDALNTLSGSSSFGSLKEGTPQIPFLKLRLSEGQNLSEEESIKGKLSFIAQSSGRSEESERDFYFKLIQTQVLKKFDPFQSEIDSLNSKIQRISQVHARKLKNININLKKNVKQVQNIQKNVQKWCKEEIQLFGGQIKQELKEFSSILGRLQIMEIRSVKKLKKHYRDYLEIQIEQCAQKLEQSQKTLAGIENILKKQRIE